MARTTNSKLGALRVASGYKSSLDASQVLGFSRSYLLSVEEGRASAPPMMLSRMATVYGATVDQVRELYRSDRRAFLTGELGRLEADLATPPGDGDGAGTAQ
jgi:transcriptional regulator with XRE-family HTH domain